MADDRRGISKELMAAIQSAVTIAFEENAHRCLVGFTSEDRVKLLGLKTILDDYSTQNLRESFHLMKTMIKARNIIGNTILVIICSSSGAWILSKLFPSVWDKYK